MGEVKQKVKKEKRVKFVEDTRTLLQIVPGKPTIGSRGGMMGGSVTESKIGTKSLGTEGLARILHAQDRQRTYKEKGTGTRCIKHRTPISYEMYFDPEHYRFYLSVPTASYRSVREHIKKAWPGAGVKVEEEDYIEIFEEQPASYCEIKMGKYYIFPLNLATNEPLNSLINVAKGLKAGEKMMFQTMMIPLKTSWQVKARELLNDYEETGVAVTGSGIEGFFKTVEDEVVEVLDILTCSLFGLKEEDKKKKTTLKPSEKELEAIRTKLSESAFKCMMRVFVIAETQSRRNELLNDVATALRAIEGRNLLEPSPIHYQVPMDMARRYAGVAQEVGFNRNVLTISEIAGLIQPPDRGTLERNPQIRRADQQETPIPKEMLNGIVPIGVINPLDPQLLYWNHRDMERFITTKVVMGAPGSGKTTYLQVLINRYYALHQSVFIFDIIKQCEFTKEVEASLEPGTYKVWDFSKEDFYNHFSFNYCELYRDYEEENYMKRQIVATLIQKQIVRFLDAMNENAQPLTPKMTRYLENVAQIVFVHKNQTLNNFIQALSDYDKRQYYINLCESAPVKPNGERLISNDIIKDVKTLDKLDEDTGEWGTDEVKIDGILTRLHILRSDPRVRRMLENPITEDYDLQDVILNPKIVMVRVPQQKNSYTGEYGYSEEIRAMITAFITFKLWLIKESLGGEGDEDELVENPLGEMVKRKDLHVVHMIYDEVHQFSQTIEMLGVHLKEFRKFRLGAVFTCHGITNFSASVQKELSKLGAAYLLLSPTEHETVDALKNHFSNLDPQEIKEMERYHLAAYVPAEGAYVSVIAKSPGPIQDFLELEKELAAPKKSKKKKRQKLTTSQRFFAQLEGAGIRLEKAENAPIDKVINLVAKAFGKGASKEDVMDEEMSVQMAELMLTHEPTELTPEQTEQLEACDLEEGYQVVDEADVPLVQCSKQSSHSLFQHLNVFMGLKQRNIKVDRGGKVKTPATPTTEINALSSTETENEKKQCALVSKEGAQVSSGSTMEALKQDLFVQRARESAARLSKKKSVPTTQESSTSSKTPYQDLEALMGTPLTPPTGEMDLKKAKPTMEATETIGVTPSPMTSPATSSTLDWSDLFKQSTITKRKAK